MGTCVEVTRGTSLKEALFAQGVEFPCGGHGRCRGCKVKVVHGQAPISTEQADLLSPDEIAAGWRLACQLVADQDMTLEIAQWEAAILADDTPLTAMPREGLGIAVDLGTTTLAAQLVDLATSHVLAIATALNPQACHGADIMTRVQHALAEQGRLQLLTLIRKQIGSMIADLLQKAGQPADKLKEVVIVGNTVMHHLFCDCSIAPLSAYPFETQEGGLKTYTPASLGWPLPEAVAIHFLPCLGGFVGSDVLAGILATGLHQSHDIQCLVDLGTNGEIVVGNRTRMLCASTAAGPAFEGARISMGMRAVTGAISEVRLVDGSMQCTVLGGGTPRGLCGSGLVDAAHAGLQTGAIQSSGRMRDKTTPFIVRAPVHVTQADIRELQLAKGAIAAGIRILLEQLGMRAEDVQKVFLAGAFGNYINRESARRIGLLPFPIDRVLPAGNTALLGAKIALLSGARGNHDFRWLDRIRHVSLSAHEHFQELFADSMKFGEADA